jgi:hypothetical protein
MRKLKYVVRSIAVLVMVPTLTQQQGAAWGGDGHRMINRLAVAALPADVPGFLRDGGTLDAVEYLGPEPDRWRNKAEGELNAAQAAEHFIDLDYADLIGALPRRRYDFVRALMEAQKAHPEMATVLTPEKVGLQPYVTLEVYQRLKAAMREYRGIVAGNKDTRPVELAIEFYCGWLGHYVGDGSMPLHTSSQYNGWTGLNPHGYTTEHHIHADFESTFVANNVRRQDVALLIAATQPKVRDDVWTDYLAYLRHSSSLVEKTYQLDKAAGFAGAGTAEGKAFAEERLAAGAEELRDMIYTAWVRSADSVEGVS